MASGPRSGSRSGWATFEDFKPASEWQQDDKSHILTIHLPGFTREQLKVSTEGQDIIRVRGERLVAGNKWTRFLENYEVPRNCDMDSVRAKFQGGILTITVGKKSNGMPHDGHPPKTTAVNTPMQPTPQKDRDESPPAADKKADLRSKQGHPDVPRDVESSSPLKNVGQVFPWDGDRKEKESSEPEEVYEEEADEPPRGTRKVVYKAIASINKEKEGDEKKDTTSKTRKREETKMKAMDRAPATSETKENVKEPKEKQARNSIDADHGVVSVEKYKKMVQGLTELNEERKLLVNMGVAVLIVMAVTAYVTYKFTSGKDQN